MVNEDHPPLGLTGVFALQISFVPVPARCLPQGVNVAVTEGSIDVVYLISESAPLPQICHDLSRITTDYASQAWVHIGLPEEQLQGAG